MFRHFFILSFFTVALLLTSPLSSQEYGEEMNAEMQVWMEYMTPGPMHEMMAKTVGEWQTESTFWMGSDGEPMKTQSVTVTEMILGGRYMKSTTKGMMMGMPFEGINLQGFDNATQEFTTIWIDNLGTGTAVSKGRYDEATNSIISEGTMVDPMIKQESKFRQVVKIIDDNHHVMEMFSEVDGQEFKMLEIHFTR